MILPKILPTSLILFLICDLCPIYKRKPFPIVYVLNKVDNHDLKIRILVESFSQTKAIAWCLCCSDGVPELRQDKPRLYGCSLIIVVTWSGHFELN